MSVGRLCFYTTSQHLPGCLPMSSGSRLQHLPGCLPMTSGSSDPERTPKIPPLAKGGAVAPAALACPSPLPCCGLAWPVRRWSPLAGASKSRRAARRIGTRGGQNWLGRAGKPFAVLVPSCGFRLSAGGAQVDRRTRVAQLRAGQTVLSIVHTIARDQTLFLEAFHS